MKHLPNRHPPAPQQDLVQRLRHQRVLLKPRHIPRNGRTLALPQPTRHLQRRFHTDKLRRSPLRQAGFGLGGKGLVGLCEAGADEDDVAGADGDVFFGDQLAEVCGRDGVGFEVGDWDAFLLGPGVEVEEDAAADDAAVLDPDLGLIVSLRDDWTREVGGKGK